MGIKIEAKEQAFARLTLALVPMDQAWQLTILNHSDVALRHVYIRLRPPTSIVCYPRKFTATILAPHGYVEERLTSLRVPVGSKLHAEVWLPFKVAYVVDSESVRFSDELKLGVHQKSVILQPEPEQQPTPKDHMTGQSVHRDERADTVERLLKRHYKLLAAYEEEQSLADDPRKMMKLKREIAREKEAIGKYEQELAQLMGNA
ncbi:MAG: hypothetical protein AAF614_24945 [Chloroflexota bacterium]